MSAAIDILVDNTLKHGEGAVTLMTKTDALIYAPDRIRANSIHPGFIWTPMVENHLRTTGASDLVVAREEVGRLHEGIVGNDRTEQRQRHPDRRPPRTGPRPASRHWRGPSSGTPTGLPEERTDNGRTARTGRHRRADEPSVAREDPHRRRLAQERRGHAPGDARPAAGALVKAIHYSVAVAIELAALRIDLRAGSLRSRIGYLLRRFTRL